MSNLKNIFLNMVRQIQYLQELMKKIQLLMHLFAFKIQIMQKNALQESNNQDIFNVGKPIYVNFFETKLERQMRLKYSPLDERLVFIKSLKKDVTEEKLYKAFSRYGQINSIRIASPKQGVLRPEQYETNFATVMFEKVEGAKNAVSDFKSRYGLIKQYDDIRELFEGQGFVTELKPKSTREQQYKNRLFTPMDQYNRYQKGGMKNQRFPPGQFPHRMPPHMQMPPGMQPSGMGYQGPKNPLMRGMPPPPGQFRNMPRQFQNRPPMNPQQFQQQQQMRQQMGPYQTPMPPTLQENRNPNMQQMMQGPLQKPALSQANFQQMQVPDLKNKLDDFLKLSQDQQRNILGQMLFPKVSKINPTNAPKITGMLIDFSIFEVTDILYFLENEQDLIERVSEAEQLIVGENE